MASLQGLFKSVPEEKSDNEKLLDLFRNRVELKKEFASLRDEKYRLQDRIKQQEGETARVLQKMEHLENLLLDRDWVYNVLAFYQLKRLAADSHAKVALFAEQLKQQREKREHTESMSAWSRQCKKRSADLEGQIANHQMQIQILENGLDAERHKLITMNGFMRIFRGSGRKARIREIESQIESGKNKEEELLRSLEDIHNLKPPDYEGLNDAAKRSINCMIISYVQHLYLHYADDDLASLVKEASEKSVGAISYGSKSDCDQLISRIDLQIESEPNVADHADILQKRAQLIAEKAEFKNVDDVVPLAESVQAVFVINEHGVVTEKHADLLGQNYFGISSVLSR